MYLTMVLRLKGMSFPDSANPFLESFKDEVVLKLATNFKNPPWPPFDKGGLGGISGEFIHTPICLFGSGSAGLGF